MKEQKERASEQINKTTRKSKEIKQATNERIVINKRKLRKVTTKQGRRM